MDQRGADNNMVLLKVDFRNAFNCIDRSAMLLADVQEHFPSLSRWVTFCYGQHSLLFFGSNEILSASGVQQGDPLGPLLFSLVLHRLTTELRERVPSLVLNCWYLDVGVLVGERQHVRRALTSSM